METVAALKQRVQKQWRLIESLRSELSLARIAMDKKRDQEHLASNFSTNRPVTESVSTPSSHVEKSLTFAVPSCVLPSSVRTSSNVDRQLQMEKLLVWTMRGKRQLNMTRVLREWLHRARANGKAKCLHVWLTNVRQRYLFKSVLGIYVRKWRSTTHSKRVIRHLQWGFQCRRQCSLKRMSLRMWQQKHRQSTRSCKKNSIAVYRMIRSKMQSALGQWFTIAGMKKRLAVIKCRLQARCHVLHIRGVLKAWGIITNHFRYMIV